MTTANNLVSRRSLLKSLTIGAVAGSVLRVIPAEAAEYAHHMIDAEKAESKTGLYAPKFFDAHQYKTLQTLCETIFPADADAGGAMEAGAPEFIDLITSENPEYQDKLGSLLKFIDARCTTKFGKAYLDCTADQQKEMLDLVAYRKSTAQDASLNEPVENFAFLRNLTADGFFTSKIGIKYLGYKGNTYVPEFPGCPPVPGV